MLQNIIIALLLIGTACAMHVEYLKLDSDEEQSFVQFLQAIDQDEELPMPGAELPGKCWACKWIVKKVKKQLGDNEKTSEAIRSKLHKVCDSIGLLKGLCKKIIRCAMHLEHTKVDSDEELSDESLDIELAKILPMPGAKFPGQCWVCKWAMGKLKRTLGNHPTKMTVDAALRHVCDGIGFLRFICKGVIGRFMGVLTAELSTSDSAERICRNIGI
ncbi:hypothetical protein NFI96_012966, partial [Prochilodus magdalenae]